MRQDTKVRSPEIERKRQELRRYETWAAIFEDASTETKKMIISNLVEKVSIGKGYVLDVQLRLSARQFFGEEDFGVDACGQ